MGRGGESEAVEEEGVRGGGEGEAVGEEGVRESMSVPSSDINICTRKSVVVSCVLSVPGGCGAVPVSETWEREIDY